jgi:NAD(P)-dependent dehydrogenase (short-subunit alcohol dehydrogenase family)
LTRYLAAYWGGVGVRVNAVVPAGIFSEQNPEFLTRYGATVPQSRMVTAQEVSNAIVFLLGDKSSGITGTSLVVDSGKTIW